MLFLYSQSSVANSIEAEVIVANEVARENIWINSLLTHLNQLKNTKPNLQIDNEVAICFVQNHEFHIRLKHFFFRELIISGEFGTENQLVDFLTKSFFTTRLIQLCNNMRIFFLSS